MSAKALSANADVLVSEVMNKSLVEETECAFDRLVEPRHENFLMWPTNGPPVRRHGAAQYLAENHGTAVNSDYALEHIAISVSGDVAIAHFYMHVFAADDFNRERARTTKSTHTWLREDNKWLLAGWLHECSRT